MAQYVLQILDENQQLIKCFEVSAESPIPNPVPEGRTQGIITDAVEFNAAVAAYEKYGLAAKYSWDGTTITWTVE